MGEPTPVSRQKVHVHHPQQSQGGGFLFSLSFKTAQVGICPIPHTLPKQRPTPPSCPPRFPTVKDGLSHHHLLSLRGHTIELAQVYACLWLLTTPSHELPYLRIVFEYVRKLWGFRDRQRYTPYIAYPLCNKYTVLCTYYGLYPSTHCCHVDPLMSGLQASSPMLLSVVLSRGWETLSFSFLFFPFAYLFRTRIAES